MSVLKVHFTRRIFIGIILGVIFGLLLKPFADATAFGWILNTLVVIGKIFVVSMKMLVVPLVFISLVTGCSALNDPAQLGRVGIKTIALYLLTTAIALTLAISCAVFFDIGHGANLATEGLQYTPKAPTPVSDVIINFFPSNPLKAMTEGNMLQIIIFALLLGIAITRSGAAGERVREWFVNMNEIMMQLVNLLMLITPFGVFALLAKLFATQSFGTILYVGGYFFCVLGVLILHVLFTNTMLLKLIARLNPVIFFRKMLSNMLFAFSTSSSNATLPITLKTVIEKLGVDEKIASFTVPLGATVNMDGTAIMQGVATVFIAHIYNVPLTGMDYMMIVATATLSSIGTAGVPGVGLILLVMVLEQVGLPVDGIALIIGVDRLLDMVRTAVNITGDAMVSCVVGTTEKQHNRDQYNAPA